MAYYKGSKHCSRVDIIRSGTSTGLQHTLINHHIAFPYITKTNRLNFQPLPHDSVHAYTPDRHGPALEVPAGPATGAPARAPTPASDPAAPATTATPAAATAADRLPRQLRPSHRTAE